VSVEVNQHGVEASIAHRISHASLKAGLFLAAGILCLYTAFGFLPQAVSPHA
jgi:NADH:ubiquinone oxidoreductase subunit 5 (subunit L)/multisubunit Na+/H+ antiporter MnhA subunit